MSIMSESIHSTASVMNHWSNFSGQDSASHFCLSENDYRKAKQYLIARGEWLFVYQNAADKRKIIETANHYVQQDGVLTI